MPGNGKINKQQAVETKAAQSGCSQESASLRLKMETFLIDTEELEKAYLKINSLPWKVRLCNAI